LGVTTIELDTAVTLDRVVVVSHDPWLSNKLTKDKQGRFVAKDKKILIKDIELDELKTYSVGELNRRSSYYYSHREQLAVPGETIPTLDEVFELIRSLGADEIRFNIEIKTYPPFPQFTVPVEEFVDLLLKTIRRHKMEERTTIQSFDWNALKLVKQEAPEIGIACLTVRRFSFEGALYNLQPGERGSSPWLAGLDFDEYSGIVELVGAFGADIISPYYKEITQDDVKEAHRQGLKIVPWTVNKERDMRTLLRWGVDGIITDKPDILKALVK
jgi:glycerophosphoryl diester phosphodiesterase